MRLLVLGGTLFVGRALAEAALARGHDVTLFNRGLTNPDLFPEAEHLRGDRRRDLSLLEGGVWDAVIDTSGYEPEVVRTSVAALPGVHYVFVSTISVYADFSHGPHERSPVHEGGTGYGELKAACERELPQDALVARPGLVVGPHDPTYRFTYWVDRIAEGGEVLAPEPRDSAVQFIDVRDLGEWLVRCAEGRVEGVFNAVGPFEPLTLEGLLEECRRVTSGDGHLHWVPADLLEERGIENWSKLPLWISDSQYAGLQQVDSSRAIAAGLIFRPVEDTIRATLDWIRSGDPLFVDQGRPKPGIDPELEAELVSA